MADSRRSCSLSLLPSTVEDSQVHRAVAKPPGSADIPKSVGERPGRRRE